MRKSLLGMLVFLCACSFQIEQAKEETLGDAVVKWSIEYNLDPVLVESIIHVETGGLKWFERDDKRRLMKQDWATNAIREFGCDTNNRKIWYSIGPMQVLYLTALHFGYKGDPDGLNDVNTNLKYGCKYLENRMMVYGWRRWDAVSAYNAGRVRYDANWKYKNQIYVDMVKKKYKEYVQVKED